MGLQTQDLQLLSESSFLPVIRNSLKQLFGAADATILTQAQSADENREQNRHFESVQGLRIAKHEISDSFCHCLLSVFYDEARKCPADRDSEHVSSLRNLMGIDIEALQADAYFGAATRDYKQRLAVIAPSILNPLDPDHFVDCFLHGLGCADIDIYTKMLILRLFEEHLYGKLGEFVRIANNALAATGVLPDLHTEPGSTAEQIHAGASEVSEDLSGLSLTEEDSLLQHALTDLQANDYEALEENLSVEHITSAVDNLKVRHLVAEMQNQKLISIDMASKARVQIEKMEIVERLFQLVITDQNLPVEARHMIACLQLPYTRIALSDLQFLPDAKHPAKVLLNEITRLCADWLPDRETLGSDALFRKLKSTVQMFIETERLESLNYKELLFEFLALREVQRQKDLEIAQRLLESQYGATSADVIREQVNKVLEEKIQGVVVPDSATRIIREGWNNVLYICALEKGLESSEWGHALMVVDELLQTFQPPEAYASRSEFLLKLPRLLKALRAGLTSIALPLELIDELFAALEDAHKKIVVKIHGDLDDLVKVATWQPQAEDEALAIALANIHQVPAKKPGKKVVVQEQVTQEQVAQEQAAPVSKAAPKPEMKAEVRPAAKPEKVAPEPEVKPVAKAEVQTEPRPEVKPVPKQEVKPPVQPQAKETKAAKAGGKGQDMPLEKPVSPAAQEKKPQKEPVAETPAAAPVESREQETRSRIGQGASLLWNKPQGQIRCKIAAHIKPLKKYIITDRSGSKIAEISEDQIEQMIARKEIETVDAGMIFDRALESVIGDIRGKR